MTNPFGVHDAWLPVLQVTLAPAPDLTIRPIRNRFVLEDGETGKTTRTQVTVTNTVTGGQATTVVDEVVYRFGSWNLDTIEDQGKPVDLAIRNLCQETWVLDLYTTVKGLDDAMYEAETKWRALAALEEE